MYTPKRLKSNTRGDSPLSSPFPSLKLSSDRVTPARGISTPSRLRDTPSRVGNPLRAGTPSRGTSVLEQDESYQLVAYGGNLPVKVAELLAATDGTNLSACIEPSGWVVVIENRKLFVWRVSSNAKKLVSCFEFQLQAAAQHKSSLVSLLETNYDNSSSQGKTSLICVSVEGVVRYWPSVTQPALYVESALNIGSDKKCYCVQSVMPYGCILVTDTNEMYQLSPSNSTITCHHISANTGVLSSIGKRMSSLWSQPVITVSKFPPVICNGTIDNDAAERFMFVTVDSKLQKWELLGTSFGTSKMVYQVDLHACVNDYAGLTEFAANASVDDVQVVDMKTTGYGVVMLLRLFLASETVLILGTFKVNMDDYAFERLQRVNEEEGNFGSNLSLLVPFGGYQAYISNPNIILSQPLTRSTREPVKVSSRKGVGIVGVGCIGPDVVYLSQRDGLVNLKVTYVAEPILLEQNQVNMINDPAADTTLETTDIYGLLRSAFILHSQGKVHNIVNVIASVEPSTEVADAVRKVSLELLNGYPPSDPRWSTSNSAFPPSSVLLLNQLRDKEKIHEEYLNFLSIYDVLEKIPAVELIDSVKIHLCENGEMLRCAITLLEMPHNLSGLVDDVINSTSLDMEVESDLLTEEVNRKDVFFAKVSNITHFFSALLKLEADKLSVLHAIQEQVDLILNVSEIVTQCFQAAWQYRQNSAHKYTSTSHIPWTSSSSGARNRTLLSHQIDLIISQALGNVDSVKSGCGLTRQVILLSDLLFDGYLREISALKETITEVAGPIEDEYNGERTRIITALMNLGYVEEATTLAEHYKDFPMLILLCEKANDSGKLKYYKVLFKNDGFNDVLYKWYVEKGAWKELMTAQDDADNFDSMLATHKQLSWLHFLGANDYSKASDVLTHLASEEKELSDRKKSMLVLANLSILAADAPPEMIEGKMSIIDQQLDILNYQEQILKSLERDPSECAPLPAEELIKLCLDESVVLLSEAQFITLVELLQFVSLYRQSLLLDIWTKCVLQEEWDATGNVDSVALVSEKTFYKCLKYWRDAGAMNDNVPMLKELTGRFGEAGSPSLLHQLKVCYEALGMQELSVGV